MQNKLIDDWRTFKSFLFTSIQILNKANPHFSNVDFPGRRVAEITKYSLKILFGFSEPQQVNPQLQNVRNGTFLWHLPSRTAGLHNSNIFSGQNNMKGEYFSSLGIIFLAGDQFDPRSLSSRRCCCCQIMNPQHHRS